MNNPNTPPKPSTPEQPSPEGLDDAICHPSFDPKEDNECTLQRHKDGRLEILSAPAVFVCAKESIEDLLARHNKLIEQRDEAIEIARKAMETVMQIYGHAQFCDECQSFEIADSCRIQMHGMDRINSLENDERTCADD
jgi:hypothetical protein